MVAFTIPIITFAALETGVDSSGKETGPQDACKSGSVTVSNGEEVTGGGNDKSNYIVLKSNGELVVQCVPVQPGAQATVQFCGPKTGCITVPKDSNEGSRLMQMFDTAYKNGRPYLGGHVLDSRSFLEYRLTSEQMGVVNNSIIGKVGPNNVMQDYSSIVDMAGFVSATPPTGKVAYRRDSFESSLNAIINGYAATSKAPASSLDDSVQRNLGQPYRLDVLTPSENWLYYGPQFVPTWEPARAVTSADVAELNAPDSSAILHHIVTPVQNTFGITSQPVSYWSDETYGLIALSPVSVPGADTQQTGFSPNAPTAPAPAVSPEAQPNTFWGSIHGIYQFLTTNLWPW